ncbi:tRNA lysidine(34) synthetase TilS [Glaciecola siphonariae]|uniref:tRNA(Ile)-lysidine synthase n=1 Tax=Glaciecola siphonariae TaxID=521012 RepID=A0ABV9LU26_9ALTE
MSSLDAIFLNNLSRSIGSARRLAIAYSGGLDSTVLLHVCAQLSASLADQTNLQLSAIQINHGLSAYAEQWEGHCKNICDSLNIPLHIKRVSVSQASGKSIEQEARNARYSAIQALAQDTELVLLAQHQNDQAETFLLQLARGAGLDGLSAMASEFTRQSRLEEQTDTRHTRFARPLLRLTRAQIEQYADAHRLSWIEDESNDDQAFYRNFLRHSVMPVLQEKWPSICATVSRSAEHCAQSAEVIDEYMALLAKQTIDERQRLLIEPLLGLSAASQSALIRYWLKMQGTLAPSTAVLGQIIQICTAKPDAQGQCGWHIHTVRRYKDKLYLESSQKRTIEHHSPENAQSPNSTAQTILPIKVTFDMHGVLQHDLLDVRLALCKADASSSSQLGTPVPDSKQESELDSGPDVERDDDAVSKLHECIYLRDFDVDSCFFRIEFGGFAKRCRLHPKRPSKSIKKWFQEKQIPPWQRAQVPILMCNDTVICVGRDINLDAVVKRAIAPKEACEVQMLRKKPSKK